MSMGPDDWKPCATLTPEDFARHPIWGFDLSREEEGGADETWVRPFHFEAAPDRSDVLFVAATLRLSSGDVAPGALCVRFVGGAPQLEDVMLLRPRYLPTSAAGRGPPMLQAFIARRLAEALGRRIDEVYPLTYEGQLRIGTETLDLRGSIGATTTR